MYDSFVSVELMSVEGEVMLAYNDYFDGTREIVFDPTHPANAKGWWGRTGDCITKFNGPFDDGISNAVYSVVVNASTGGLYLGMSAILCGGFALAGGEMYTVPADNTFDQGTTGFNRGTR